LSSRTESSQVGAGTFSIRISRSIASSYRVNSRAQPFPAREKPAGSRLTAHRRAVFRAIPNRNFHFPLNWRGIRSLETWTSQHFYRLGWIADVSCGEFDHRVRENQTMFLNRLLLRSSGNAELAKWGKISHRCVAIGAGCLALWLRGLWLALARYVDCIANLRYRSLHTKRDGAWLGESTVSEDGILAPVIHGVFSYWNVLPERCGSSVANDPHRLPLHDDRRFQIGTDPQYRRSFGPSGLRSPRGDNHTPVYKQLGTDEARMRSSVQVTTDPKIGSTAGVPAWASSITRGLR
jgi:hypothetical protein